MKGKVFLEVGTRSLAALATFRGNVLYEANFHAMATRLKPQNSFVLSCIEFIFGMEAAWDNRHQPHTSLLW